MESQTSYRKTTRYLHHTIRIFAGLLFVAIFGSKFGFLPSAVNTPEVFTPEGFAFISAVDATGYMFPIIGIVSLFCGLAFLANRYVALAAVILVPITLNFALFHLFLGLPINSVFHFFRELAPFVFLALNVYLLYSERRKYTALLKG